MFILDVSPWMSLYSIVMHGDNFVDDGPRPIVHIFGCGISQYL